MTLSAPTPSAPVVVPSEAPAARPIALRAGALSAAAHPAAPVSARPVAVLAAAQALHSNVVAPLSEKSPEKIQLVLDAFYTGSSAATMDEPVPASASRPAGRIRLQSFRSSPAIGQDRPRRKQPLPAAGAPAKSPTRQQGGALLGNIIGAGGIVGLGIMAWNAWDAVSFTALPAALPSWWDLMTMGPNWALSWHWAAISIVTSFSSAVVSKLIGDRRNGESPDFKLRHLLFLFPIAALIEELIFRALLMFPLAALLLQLTPLGATAAMVIAAAASSAIFAGAHGYGAMLPRLLAGLIFSYAFLTGGLLFAAAVHFLDNALVIAWVRFTQIGKEL